MFVGVCLALPVPVTVFSKVSKVTAPVAGLPRERVACLPKAQVVSVWFFSNYPQERVRTQCAWRAYWCAASSCSMQTLCWTCSALCFGRVGLTSLAPQCTAGLMLHWLLQPLAVKAYGVLRSCCVQAAKASCRQLFADARCSSA